VAANASGQFYSIADRYGAFGGEDVGALARVRPHLVYRLGVNRGNGTL
jgi:hypothetical protein